MKIDLRQRLAVAQHQSDARNGRRDGPQRRLHVEDHPGSQCGHKRRIAREVNRIPEALLGKQQNGLVLQRLGAKSQRRDRASPNFFQRHS